MITNSFYFLIVLSTLIFFHELGHFTLARCFGVGVEKFSLGFGPRLFGYRVGITDYCVSAIPLGGYVKMVGDDPNLEIDHNMEALSFAKQHVFKRILIVLAGPAFNILLACILLFIIFSTSGIFFLKPILGNVLDNMPASRSGLQSGDVIVSIDEKAIMTWEDMSETISKGDGSSIDVGFIRSGVHARVVIVPSMVDSSNIFGQQVKKYAVGITPTGDVSFQELTFFEAIYNSLIKTYDIACLTVVSIIKLLHGTVPIENLGGPIMIAEMAGDYAKSGVIDLIFFIALLSINIGILNCLPIPVLDGGHLVFFIIEVIIRKPVNVKFREWAQRAGALILLLLMVCVFYNDIIRLFSD